MSEDNRGVLPLPKNIPKNYLKLFYPVHGNDKILVKFNKLPVKYITDMKWYWIFDYSVKNLFVSLQID